MNLLNYVDRYVFFSAGPEICEELHFSDPQFGQLSVSFMIVYTIVSPFVGYVGDRYNRKRLLAFGVGLWSIATVGTAFARGYYDMFFWRALLGIGEASYGSIAPALLADLFKVKSRGRVMGLYYFALPVGGAIGYLIGGHFAHTGAWRHAFWVVGIPGLIAAFAGLLMHDPGRGASEGSDASKAGGQKPTMRDYFEIFKTPSFLFNTAGQAAVTFAIGAYAVWGATFYNRVRGMDLNVVGRDIGVLTAAAGAVGIILGMFVPDLIRKVTRRAYFIWPFLAVAIAAPFATFALLEPVKNPSLVYLFVASVMMASVLAPSNTITANVVPANRRAAGYAICIFLVHLFGDISSPWLIGEISKLFGSAQIIESPIGKFFDSIGASPTTDKMEVTNLTVGMLSVVPMLALGAFFYLVGARYLPEDERKAREASSGETELPVAFH